MRPIDELAGSDEVTAGSGGGRLRIVGATDGDPWARATWSGSSQRLFAALERRGALVAAVNVKPRALDLAEKAASWSPDAVRWRQRYRGAASPISPLVRSAMSAVGSRRARGRGDAVLQISGWYDASRGEPKRALATYQDANGALWRRRPELVLDRDDPGLARARVHERRVYDACDVILTMSDWARRSFVEDYGQAEEKVVTVGAGVSLDALPEDWGPRDPSPPRVLFVGRNYERKGGPELLAAFARLREVEPDARLWIVGPPVPERTAIPGVTWFGPIYRDDPDGARRLDELFRAATVYALPSRYEGFGMPFLEAMAYGLPCVGTHVCAIPEIVRDGITGALVAPGDVGALAEALSRCSDARPLGVAGRAAVDPAMTWDAVAGRVIDAIADRLP